MNDERDLYDLMGSGEADRERYRQKVRDSLRKNLDEVVSSEEIITAPSGKQIKVNIPDIREPHFWPASDGQDHLPSGIGAGEGGEPIHRVPLRPAREGGAGKEHSEPQLSVYIPLEEAARWLWEDLHLPLIESKKGALEDESFALTARGRTGAVMDRKRTLLRYLARSQGATNAPWTESDLTYRRWSERMQETTQAAVVLVRDASGSITPEMQYIIRVCCFWTVLWLRHNYPRVQIHFVIHDTEAEEVDEAAFFKDQTRGGTRVSSGLLKAEEILQKHYPVNEWNRFVLYFSDGDNWEEDDDTLDQVITRLADSCELVAYGQTVENHSPTPVWITMHRLNASHRNVEGGVVASKEQIRGWLRYVFRGKGAGEYAGMDAVGEAKLRDRG